MNQRVCETLHGEKYGHRVFHYVLGELLMLKIATFKVCEEQKRSTRIIQYYLNWRTFYA